MSTVLCLNGVQNGRKLFTLEFDYKAVKRRTSDIVHDQNQKPAIQEPMSSLSLNSPLLVINVSIQSRERGRKTPIDDAWRIENP